VNSKIPSVPYVALELKSIENPEFKVLIDNALLDTGSCITLIPLGLLEEVEARPTGSNEVINGISGELIVRNYWTTVVFNGCEISLTARAWNGEVTIIGRDLINRYRIDFNGPNEKLTIHTGGDQSRSWLGRFLSTLFTLFSYLTI
jgi:predicted aspartyl protease